MTDPDLSTREPHSLENLRVYGEGFAGRQAELAALDQAWSQGTRIFVLHAEGGAGKTRVVAKWLTQMSEDGYGGAGGVFVQSFYSQGSNEQGNASSELFFEQALEYFGHTGPLLIDPTEQGRTLARLIRGQRGLLVLDGLEPLQHPPSFDQGRLKDPAIRSLLLALAAGRLGDSSASPSGLCVVTSRQPVVELQDREGRAVVQQPLDRLDAEAGAELLRQLGVRGPERELRQAVEDSRGHAYSLMLLGTYLRDATDDHEIRRRHEIPLLDEDAEHRYHARHLFWAYVEHLGESSPEIAVLRLLGFFDRPAEEKLVAVLRETTKSGLDALTSPLWNLSSADWHRVLRRLKVLRLVDVPNSASSSIDSHPLLREYFAEQLRMHFPEAWQAGHQRLFEYLCNVTEYQPATLTGLQPLYQAVTHGCLAGLHPQACDVYHDRILRGTGYDGFYSWKRLGALSADLGAMACFFTMPWTIPAPTLALSTQGWVLNQAAQYLQALGRLSEAVVPLRTALRMTVERNDWGSAAIVARNLSELELNRGEITAAVTIGEQAATYADRTGDLFKQACSVAKIAAALHQEGHRAESRRLFEDAEYRQVAHKAEPPYLYSLRGFQYCDFLLADMERSAWQRCLNQLTTSLSTCDSIIERVNTIFGLRKLPRWHSAEPIFDVALDHLTLARVMLYMTHAASAIPQSAHDHIAAAVDGFRASGQMDYLPCGLLTRAWIRFLSGDETGCQEDLDEAWEIAERGPMPLYQADILLYRARLFRDLAALAEARRLIEKHGYHRRDEELADAEAAAEHWNDKEPSMPKSTKTFISYSHDNEQHSQRILALANQLRAQGVDAEIDQYESRPPQGWSLWCEEQLRPESSEFVLVVCTETYLNRVEKRVPADEGLGVFWEGSVIRSYIYEEKSNNRFLPVLFDPKDGAYIPRPLKDTTRYLLTAFDLSDPGYEALYRELTHQPAVQRPPLGEVVTLRRGGISFERSVSDTQVLPPVAPRKVLTTFSSAAAAHTEPDLLEELKGLPAAWFEELVHRFDKHNAVSARPAPQSTRAIDLLKIVEATEDGPDRLREEIRRLKENQR
ncbi:MAG TPA: SEFIR domain-containing protein [Thermoanaerobaculia bacterium]